MLNFPLDELLNFLLIDVGKGGDSLIGDEFQP